MKTKERKPTIWESLCLKLGRNPTSKECREECQRIIKSIDEFHRQGK